MKLSKTETLALERVKGLKPMTDEERTSLPSDSDAWSPQQRRRYREDRLCHSAEVLDRRQLRNSLYQHAVRTGDKGNINYYRVTALDTSTARIRRDLVDAYRALMALGEEPASCAA